jgi:hypothetical protein
MLAAMKEQAGSLGAALPGARPLLVRAVDRALAFEKPARWQSARAMFDALRAAYDDARQQPPSIPQTPASVPPQSIPLELSFSSMLGEESSLVVSVAFGEQHNEELERERRRTREFVEGLSDLSISISPDAVDDKR